MGWRDGARSRRDAALQALEAARAERSQAELLLADVDVVRRARRARHGSIPEPLLVLEGAPRLHRFRRGSTRRLQVAAYREVIEALVSLDFLLPARELVEIQGELESSCLPAVAAAETLLQIHEALTELQRACASAGISFEDHTARAELAEETVHTEALLATLRQALLAHREHVLAARAAEAEAQRVEAEAQRALDDLLVLGNPIPRLDPATAAQLAVGADAVAARTRELREATEGLSAGTEALTSLRARTRALLRR